MKVFHDYKHRKITGRGDIGSGRKTQKEIENNREKTQHTNRISQQRFIISLCQQNTAE